MNADTQTINPLESDTIRNALHTEGREGLAYLVVERRRCCRRAIDERDCNTQGK